MNAETLRALMHYEPSTGIFTNVVSRSSRAIKGMTAGSPDKEGYLQIRINGKNMKAHRLAWLYMTGEWPTGCIDHLNGFPADNRWENLRDASPAINSQNTHRARCDSGTGLLGASYDKQRRKHLAQISINGKKKNLGRFATAIEAHAAHIAAKRQLHEGNTL